MDWRTEFYEARWHLDVAKRMLEVYEEYSEKRILIGVIREAAKAAGKLVRAFLILDNTKGNLEIFVNKVAPKYLSAVDIKYLVKVLNIERDQKRSRVEFSKGENILFEVEGKWKILEVSKLKKIVNAVNKIVNNFPTGIKR